MYLTYSIFPFYESFSLSINLSIYLIFLFYPSNLFHLSNLFNLSNLSNLSNASNLSNLQFISLSIFRLSNVLPIYLLLSIHLLNCPSIFLYSSVYPIYLPTYRRKCCACHEICAGPWAKVLYLPLPELVKFEHDFAKVLRLPRNLYLTLRKRCTPRSLAHTAGLTCAHPQVGQVGWGDGGGGGDQGGRGRR